MALLFAPVRPYAPSRTRTCFSKCVIRAAVHSDESTRVARRPRTPPPRMPSMEVDEPVRSGTSTSTSTITEVRESTTQVSSEDILEKEHLQEEDVHFTWFEKIVGATPQGMAFRAAVGVLALAYAASSALSHLTAPMVASVPVTLDMPTADSNAGFDVFGMVSEFVAGPRFLVSLGMGFSAFIQALTGFGFAIVSVGALTQLDWIAHSSVFNTVQPVAATLGALTGWILIFPEIGKIKWRDIRTLLIATTITTPAGALLLEHIDSLLVIRALGAIISGYVLYSVLGIQVPKSLGGEFGAWLLGLLAGALGGAFDITGPPLVVHGEAAKWQTDDGEFRRNVLAVVSINSTLVVLWDLFSGRLDDFYYFDFLKYAAPSVVIGILAGDWLSSRLDASSFKKVVLGTCLVLGVKLLLS